MTNCLVKCKTVQHLHFIMNTITESGGEGVLCKEPESIYSHGKSESLKHVKTTSSQQYALLVSDVGSSYQALLPSGITFDADLDISSCNDIKSGDVVVVAYSYLYHGKPLEPVIVDVKREMIWDDVLNMKYPVLQSVTQPNFTQVNTKVPFGHWTAHSDNVRVFFDSFAENLNFDSLVAENWYNMSTEMVKARKSGASVLSHYNGSLVNALLDVYPDVGLDPSEFATVAKRYWALPESRRKFFDKIAQKKRFDPLIPSNWYNIDKQEFDNEKGASSVLGIYGDSVVKALIDLYPEVNFEESEFSSSTRRGWHPKRRLQIFNDFASRHNFNPNSPEKWHSLTLAELNEDKELNLLLKVCYGGSLMRALKDVYPNVEIDGRQLKSRRHWYWHKAANRKKFFDSFAFKRGFDPLVVNHWRSVSAEDFRKEEGGRALMDHYNNSLTRALTEVYPSMVLGDNFGTKTRNYWSLRENRRKFFDELARSRGCDPLQPRTWYNFTRKDLIKVKGGAAILAQYSNSLCNALLSTYPDIGLEEHELRSQSKVPKNKAVQTQS